MKYCGECGHKNPENNQFCENCGAPLQNKSVSTRSSRKRSTRSPRKKRSGCWKFLVGIVVIIALALWGISRLGDGDADEGTLCEVSLDEDNLVSDFQMSDIDWLIDYALNCELLDQEYIKVLSNGLHDGAFLSGIGEYSDERVFDEVLEDMMAKYDNYKEAFLRLEQLDLFDTGDGDLLSVAGVQPKQMLSATWIVAAAAGSGSGGLSSWGREKIEWLGAQITGAQKDHDQMVATLRQMGAFKDQKMQKAIFECINNTGGYKDAHSFFVALNNGEMPHLGANHLSQILKNLEWIDGDTHTKWVEAEKALKCHKTYAEHWCERGKELGNKGVELELKVLDKLTNGGISKVQKLEEYAQNIKKFKEVLFDGKKEKLTEEDIRMAMRKNGIDKLRKLMPKTGNDTADKVLNFICDKLQAEALREDPSGKIAGEKGLTLIDLMNGKGDLSKAVIVTGEDGRVQIVIPDGKGGGKTITVPGKKRISVVTKNGKRSKTAKVKAKKGKLSVGKKEKTAEKEDNPVGDMESQEAPPKGDHWKLVKRDIHAENNGEVFRGTKMEGTYGRFHMKSQQLDDGQLSSPPDHKNCKGEYYECAVTYTEPKKYYTPNDKVESTVSSHSSHSNHICGVPFGNAGISARLLVGDGERWPRYPDLKNAKGEYSIYTQRLQLNDPWAVKYQDFSDVVSTTIPKTSSSDSIMVIEFYFAHGRGEDAIRISYTYHFVKGADEKDTKNASEEQEGRNGIQERKPEAVDGKNSLGITGNEENITIK